MKVICKKNATEGYYSGITPEKEYETYDTHFKLYYVIVDDLNQKAYYLKEYFYSTEEIREKKLKELV
jgi:hypothetical protein